MNITNHTIKLQDGSLFNFKRRFKKKSVTLLQMFSQVIDGRKEQGKRHSLSLILFILFAGVTTGETTVAGCHLWAVNNLSFIGKFFDIPLGLPVETTISRAIAIVDVESLIDAYRNWWKIMFNNMVDAVASFDGKSIRAIHGLTVGGHILSLFTHTLHQILGQIEVKYKENEIPAAQRLFQKLSIAGLTLVADALHAQKETVNIIRERNAHYFLFVKTNQEELLKDIAFSLKDDVIIKEVSSYQEITRQRHITAEVFLTHDPSLMEYLNSSWKDIAVVGKIHRKGTRTAHGLQTVINETVYFISSRTDLTAKEAIEIARNHWSIENNLHWQKDYTWFEDRQRLRSGNAPSIMSFLRSSCISLFNLFSFGSITGTINNFRLNKYLHHRFLSIAAVV